MGADNWQGRCATVTHGALTSRVFDGWLDGMGLCIATAACIDAAHAANVLICTVNKAHVVRSNLNWESWFVLCPFKQRHQTINIHQ